jgi:predicted O-methyltransferase YrrM
MGLIVPDAIERYLADLNSAGDDVLDEIARGNEARGLPLVDAEVGALLRVLATAASATRILEIGTAIGYSGIWLAGGLPPGGMLLTMELSEERAAEAKANFARAGLADRVSVIVGDAQLKIAKVSGPFDLIFQDGAKSLYEPLLDRLVGLLRPGGLLVTDNVLWNGEVVPGYSRDPKQPPEDTRAIAAYNKRLAAHPDLITAVVPLRDGVSISVKKREVAGC